MNRKLKLTAIGESTGVVLPKDVLGRLRVGRDDELALVETPDGVLLAPYDPRLDNPGDVAARIMRRRRSFLRRLFD